MSERIPILPGIPQGSGDDSVTRRRPRQGFFASHGRDGCQHDRLVDWIVSWDVAVFRWINRGWSHPALDPLMRFLSGNPLFVPALGVLAVVLIWKDRPRGLVFVLLLAAAAGMANGLVADPLKHWIERPRPYAALPDAVLRVGRGNPLGSMPSAHAMNVGLMATVAGWYYRRAIPWLVPLALAVAVSRVYNGAHFPGDVLAGLGIGVGVGAFVVAGAQFLWRRLAPRVVPALAVRVPSLAHPGGARPPESRGPEETRP